MFRYFDININILYLHRYHIYVHVYTKVNASIYQWMNECCGWGRACSGLKDSLVRSQVFFFSAASLFCFLWKGFGCNSARFGELYKKGRCRLRVKHSVELIFSFFAYSASYTFIVTRTPEAFFFSLLCFSYFLFCSLSTTPHPLVSMISCSLLSSSTLLPTTPLPSFSSFFHIFCCRVEATPKNSQWLE